MPDNYNLKRFLDAQQSSYNSALAEIKAGRKRSHWMWFIFPQIKGLGFSEAARYYGIKDLDEARAYLEHPVLGQRLIEICRTLIGLKTNSANEIFGNPDDLKLRSCVTLFSSVPNADPVFYSVLEKFFSGKPDPKTLGMIGKG